MSEDNANSFAGLGSVLSAFGQAANTSRDVESARTALREPSPVRSPPPAWRSPSPPSVSYSRNENTATYNYQPSHHYSTNHTSASSYNRTSSADCRDMTPLECGITFVVGMIFFVLIIWAESRKTKSSVH